MLQALGLLVHRFPAVAKEGNEVSLEDAVTADGSEGGVTAVQGEDYALVRYVLQQTLLGQPLDHSAD